MNTKWLAAGAISLGFLLSATPSILAQSQPQPQPQPRLHAHNDYAHTRPLLDALDHGFCSIEADVHLVDGRLLVAHGRSQVKPERTLEALYLDPLRARVQQNGGRVYRDGPEITLLIDLKGSWKTSYPVLRRILEQYSDMLTSFRDGTTELRAVRVIVSGDRSREMFAGESIRFAALDGTLEDLRATDPAGLIPWISVQWSQVFKWRAAGEIPEAEQLKLAEMVTQAHQQGRKLRFWGAPDKPAFWSFLLKANVDLINTDDLSGAEKFLLEQPK